ncbi:MAG: hypothetical protein IKA46_07045 [Clostridia bacterium]|nr:hypothetical protein [Clostridia bacterium]
MRDQTLLRTGEGHEDRFDEIPYGAGAAFAPHLSHSKEKVRGASKKGLSIKCLGI